MLNPFPKTTKNLKSEINSYLDEHEIYDYSDYTEENHNDLYDLIMYYGYYIDNSEFESMIKYFENAFDIRTLRAYANDYNAEIDDNGHIIEDYGAIRAMYGDTFGLEILYDIEENL